MLASVSPPLPTHDFSARFDEASTHMLHEGTSGILRCGEEDELLVVELGIQNQCDSLSSTIDLNVLHVGSSRGWERTLPESQPLPRLWLFSGEPNKKLSVKTALPRAK
jgi:hypothetical protein